MRGLPSPDRSLQKCHLKGALFECCVPSVVSPSGHKCKGCVRKGIWHYNDAKPNVQKLFFMVTPIGNSQRDLLASKALLDVMATRSSFTIGTHIISKRQTQEQSMCEFTSHSAAPGFTDIGIPSAVQHSECFTQLNASPEAMVFSLNIRVTHLLDSAQRCT